MKSKVIPPKGDVTASDIMRSSDREIPPRYSIGASVGPTLIFLFVLILRSPGLLVRPRFWAEEGTLYYAQLQQLGTVRGITHVINGNYQLLTNVIVELALLAPVRWSAVVTTYVSLAVAIACAWMIAEFFVVRRFPIWVASAVCALFALQPAGYEVFLSATNVQWVTSVMGLLLCVSKDHPATSRAAILRFALLLACGLTGTTTCILLPLFAVGAWRRRTPFGWCLLGTLIVATAVQGTVVAFHRDDLQRRPFALSLHAPLALVLQVALAQVLPVDILDHVGEAFIGQAGAILSLALVVMAGLLAFARSARGTIDGLTREALLGGIVIVSLINEFGALGTATGMSLGLSGSRYFFLGATCLLILVGICLTEGLSIIRLSATAFVTLAALNDLSTAAFASWTKVYLEGPSVAEQIDQCDGRTPCEIRVWPTWVRKRLVVHPPP